MRTAFVLILSIASTLGFAPLARAQASEVAQTEHVALASDAKIDRMDRAFVLAVSAGAGLAEWSDIQLEWDDEEHQYDVVKYHGETFFVAEAQLYAGVVVGHMLDGLMDHSVGYLGAVSADGSGLLHRHYAAYRLDSTLMGLTFGVGAGRAESFEGSSTAIDFSLFFGAHIHCGPGFFQFQVEAEQVADLGLTTYGVAYGFSMF
jgi:hypothetical protein